VETVGDCYVAVAGLPEKRDDHAVVMALFARDCLVAFNRLVKQMEVDLGPDTAGTLPIVVGDRLRMMTRTDGRWLVVSH
jgi:hypothetical protein